MIAHMLKYMDTLKAKHLFRQDTGWKHLLMAGLIVLASFGVYANALPGEFVWDDTTLFIEYGDVWQWKNLSRLLTLQDNLFRYNDTGFYRPLVNVTFLVDRWIWGPHSFGFHLTNSLFHVLASLAVFWITNRLYKSLWTSGTAGLLFAVHPIHVEAVAWINGRNNLVAITFYLFSFYFYLLATERNKFRFYFASAVFIALSLFSKEYAVTFPLVILLYEMSVGRSISGFKPAFRRTITAWIYCGLIFSAYAWIRMTVIPGQADIDLQLNSLGSRLLNLPVIFSNYIKLLVLPIHLTPYHSLTKITHPTTPEFIVPFAFSIGIMGVWWLSYTYEKRLFFCLGWMLIALLPVLNIIPIPFAVSPISERHLYLPSVGYCIVLAGLFTLFNTWISKGAVIKYRWVPLVLILVLAELYGFETVKRNLVWRNELTLWQDTVKKNPDDFRVQSNLAIAYAGKGRTEEALRAAQNAVHLNPAEDTPHFILASILLKSGKLPEAVDALRTVLEINPHHQDAGDLLKQVKDQSKNGATVRPDECHPY